MGMQGPLTAQALGRSPYDDVAQGEGEEDPRMPLQQYDHGGRPINPETIRINRDIIRAHNEVMTVIGVAEPENPNSGPEAELKRQHEDYEEDVGETLASWAKRCLEGIGIFGVNGLRERILIYKRYSEIPFWNLYRQGRGHFSLSRDILAGAPASILRDLIEPKITRLWILDEDKALERSCVLGLWSYARAHLEAFAIMQRLGLIPSNQWLPRPSFFIPFSSMSPILMPHPPTGFWPTAIVQWFGRVVICATPLLVWHLSQQILGDWRYQFWTYFYRTLPSTAWGRKAITLEIPEIPSPVNEPSGDTSGVDTSGVEDGDASPPVLEAPPSSREEPAESLRRPSIISARDDVYASDEENEGVRATLISFDVEATESSADAPQGLWSAELRPSSTPDLPWPISGAPIYLDNMLTQVPAWIATHVFTNAATRILIAPYEATAIRLLARTFRIRAGLPCDDIHPANMLTGLNWTLAMNFLGAELFHLVLSSGVWAAFTGLYRWYHMSEEEFKAHHQGKSKEED